MNRNTFIATLVLMGFSKDTVVRDMYVGYGIHLDFDRLYEGSVYIETANRGMASEFFTYDAAIKHLIKTLEHT